MNESSPEKTLVICKPDAVAMGVIQAIMKVYEEAGFELLHVNKFRMSKETASEFYVEHQLRHYFPGTVLAMTSGDCVAIVIQGEKAIEEIRKLHGPTKDAPKGTIRGDFPSAGGPFNTVHASDSTEAAKREMTICFPKLR